MVKMGCLISPPCHKLTGAASAVVAEKFEIATAHQVHSGADQPDCSIAEIMCLPGGAGWHAPFAKEPLRNRAIGFASEVCVERAKDERESAAPRRREAIRRAVARSLGDGLPQAKRSVSAGGEVLIERNDSRGGSRDRCAADEHDRSAILKDEVLALACCALEYWRQRGDAARLAESLWRGREKNDRRSKMRQPSRGVSVGALVRIEREISNPNG
jgi:hypothetical protein